MYFTREPIIETVITPREGNKLIVRSSGGDRDEYSVDALEVVSFGSALFFRATERQPAFLLPVSDYEVIETKEVKVPLKVSSGERSIRIGGGRDAAVRQAPKESREGAGDDEGEDRDQVQEQRFDKKRDRRRRGRRRDDSGSDVKRMEAGEPLEGDVAVQAVDKEAADVAPSFISKLFPPPPTLIKETLNRYKIVEGENAPERASSLPTDMVEQGERGEEKSSEREEPPLEDDEFSD